MKKVLLTLSIALISLASCSKDETTVPTVGEVNETYIDASSKTTWHYYNLASNKFIGAGENTKAGNEEWFARTDWDLAINTYHIRTNSGVSSSTNAKGGTYTLAPTVTFASVLQLPAEAKFKQDREIEVAGMGGKPSIYLKSEDTVIYFKINEETGNVIMPPIYLATPVYIFRTANGKEHYKVQFTQYQNENKKSGHVKFNSASIE